MKLCCQPCTSTSKSKSKSKAKAPPKSRNDINRNMQWQKRSIGKANKTGSAEKSDTDYKAMQDYGKSNQGTGSSTEEVFRQNDESKKSVKLIDDSYKDFLDDNKTEEVFRPKDASEKTAPFNENEATKAGESNQNRTLRTIDSVISDVSGELNSVPEDTSLTDFSSMLGDGSNIDSAHSTQGDGSINGTTRSKGWDSGGWGSSFCSSFYGAARSSKARAPGDLKDMLISIEDVVELRCYAELGPIWLGGVCFVGGAAMSLSVGLDLLAKSNGEEPWPGLYYFIFSFYTWLFGMLVIILEGRPFQIQVASVHLWISDYLKILRLLWGRGLLYTFIGSLQYFGLATGYSKIAGGFVMIVGFVCFLIGLAAKVCLDNARATHTSDHSLIKLKFNFYDIDNDGYLDVGGFQDFVICLGLNELDNINIDTAFHAIDEDNDGKISFIELERWWSVVDYRNQSNILDYRVSANYNISGAGANYTRGTGTNIV